MSVTAPEIDRIAPTRRPRGRACGRHRWSDLLFLHWRVPADDVQRLLPAGLTVDAYDGSAWVGLVPFDLFGVRPWWFPAVRGVSDFHETNVRTYVHHEGRDPGVWFFSLDASRSLPVRIARWKWHLPYFRAEMEVDRDGDVRRYRSRRLWPAPTPADAVIEAALGDWYQSGTADPGLAAPDTLEHFLVERYVLYAVDARGRLFRGFVHHAPYRLQTARVRELRETLIGAADISVNGPAEHVLYSPGVEVEVFALEPAEAGTHTQD